MKDRDNYWGGFLTGALSVLVCVLLFVGITAFTGALDWPGLLFGRSTSVMTREVNQKLREVQAYIDKYFLDDIDKEKMEESLCQGMVAGLGDRYAAYYNIENYADMREKTMGNYCGIGAYVSQDATTGAITIVEPIEGGPAWKAGVKAGDIISEVDGKSVEEMDLSSIVSTMKGKEGTKVKVSIWRDGEKKTRKFTITREEILTPTVDHKMLEGKIGLIAVSAFEDVTKKQFRDALDELEAEGEKALIIDLRNNGGGLITTAVDMLDRLLPKGLLVYTQDKKGKKEEYNSTDDESFDKPIVILVNGHSASASEVFAGAMQDYEKAVLVGTTTFGKGIVQSVFDLTDGTALKLTTSKYYTPKGRNIHGIGLEPDIKVELEEQKGSEIDNQVQSAIEYLKKQ